MSDEFGPTVRTIVESIRSRIIDGTYRVGSSLPSENEIATDLQVGRGSVRKAIEALTETGEIERERYARPLIARQFARKPDSEKTDVYVWVAQTIRDHTTVPFLQIISRELAGTQYRMIVREPSFFVESVVQADERNFLLELMRQPNVAGAIIWRDAFADHSDVVQQLLDRGIPLVFVDSTAPGNLQTDFVGTANSAAAKRCVRHLIDLGHRRIVCISDTDIPYSLTERMKGYSRAMKQVGIGGADQTGNTGKCIIPPYTGSIHQWHDPLGGVYARFLDENSFYSDLAHRAVTEILSLDPLPTALFVTYDVLAIWIWAILEGKGIRVPEQMSIVGFDWRAQWDKGVVDELTTASQDFEGFGRHAVELLIDRITGENPPTPRHVLLDAPLIIRSSTATPQSSRPEVQLAVTTSG